jgi:hypothetical protein
MSDANDTAASIAERLVWIGVELDRARAAAREIAFAEPWVREAEDEIVTAIESLNLAVSDLALVRERVAC